MKISQWWENIAIRFMHPHLFAVDDSHIRQVVQPKPPSEHARANAAQLAVLDAWERESLRGR